jgi:lambda repressor-like predicted transcriptional regulator
MVTPTVREMSLEEYERCRQDGWPLRAVATQEQVDSHSNRAANDNSSPPARRVVAGVVA